MARLAVVPPSRRRILGDSELPGALALRVNRCQFLFALKQENVSPEWPESTGSFVVRSTRTIRLIER